jgi:hypothetical protein
MPISNNINGKNRETTTFFDGLEAKDEDHDDGGAKYYYYGATPKQKVVPYLLSSSPGLNFCGRIRHSLSAIGIQ